MIRSIDILYKSSITRLFFVCYLAHCLWGIKLNTQTLEELIYSKEDHAQDMSKIYCDLARISENRGDFNAAISAYHKALEYNPAHHNAQQRLLLCREVLLAKS